MSEFNPPVADIEFLLNEVFNLPQQWANNPILAERVDADTASAMLAECAKLSRDMIAPFSREADEQGCSFSEGKVTTAKGHKAAYQALSEGGWGGLTGNPDFGALGMPKALAVHCEEMFASADLSFSLFPMLTAGACLALNEHGSDELKQQYLPKMYSGEWAGSMCLTEPHAGSDLGIIRSKATAQDDGSYAISGTKIFITGGEHDLTDNIIHLVLAKLPDAPAGPKGISMFLVPKILNNGQANKLSCGSIEHKMGIKASPTCVMNFDGATGYLVGQENRGLMAMFTMMNYERVGVGIQGIGPAERSYQCAAQYARERLQGRRKGVSPDQAESLLVHPDVRRMLFTMRAFTEAGRCFSTYTANLLDITKFSDDEQAKQQAAEQVALLTPIVKGFCTDRGLETCVLGQQVLGGHGFIREWGQEQLVRDVRITQIYEGTNGIQAMDLLGRKVAPNQGASVAHLIAEAQQFADSATLTTEMKSALLAACQQLQECTQYIVEQGSPELIGATAVYYQDLIGYVIFAYMWAKMAAAANSDSELHRNKRTIAQFYYSNLLPRIDSLKLQIMADHSALMAMEEAAF
ncbi:acyl-CoA dehydrogenase C-terminal domain-containing protein [Dasania sp. GY-MA-18]|uniref:3-methylmercaptopropionyl-CoA dehydrogenase n=1 Tax=Dasania phycosphaerae TaxID=2950436 RepID=A0A9J6RND0_9GAMM|nr:MULTISPECIES: acyl-CoA dehydrogenase C-terminal domain-containing protein [Dasania]MCR8923256.1 acyl-CoA dehydrogenase C-terminal domain-containing protein [Dasania sp. GY-MA-18]MCZ0865688.1 acyl-CoA dehydrogenase C-terminal domain-containing protein [Dasania phycosphaerae]MCZ0869413.1 acyl-CoA dehydrogenase C-terminal domain-containing protein [Dasania phycosphaerae]